MATCLIIRLPIACTSNSQTLHTYILANYHQFAHDGAQSLKLYKQLIAKNVSPMIYKGYIPFLHAHGKYQEIVKFMPVIDQRYQDDIEIQHKLAQSLVQTGNKSLGVQKLSALNKKFPENQEIAFELIKLHLEHNSYQQANSIIDSLLNTSARKPNNFIFISLNLKLHFNWAIKKKRYSTFAHALSFIPNLIKAG